MVEEKDMYIKYIKSKENPTGIMKNNCSKAKHVKHTKIIKEGELWYIVETWRENVNNNAITNMVMYYYSTEYSSHALANPMEKSNGNEWVLVTISSSSK